ncbi:MAG: tetratricopeptide repeat protein [Candidatus Acidiferrum sp.]
MLRTGENLWRWALFLGSALLICVAPTVRAKAGHSSLKTSSPQSPGPIAEAHSALARGNTEEAIQILSNHLLSDPKDAPAMFALGQAYAMEGKNGQAEEEFQSALKISPDNYIALAALAELYAQEGQFEKAEPLLDRASKLSQGDPHIRREWGMTLARLHKYKEAQSALAGLPPPNDPNERISFYRLQASVAMALGHTESAASEMEKALSLNPSDSGMILATAVAEVQAGNWERAASLAEPIFSHTQDSTAGIVVLESQLGRHADVHRTLDLLRSTKLPPAEELAFRQRLAKVLIAHSEYSESIVDLTKASELDPQGADLLFNLALAQFRAGHLEDALQSAEKCKAVNDGAEIEDLLGDIQEGSGDNLAAVRSYQAAVVLAPDEEKYRLSLAVEFIRHKSFEPARIVLKEAEKLDPRSWRIELARGMVEHFAGSDEEASQILVHAAVLAPESEVALKYLGDIQMDQTSSPDPAAIAQLCGYADRHPGNGDMEYYCGALLFRRDYVSGEKRDVVASLHRLRTAAKLRPLDASAHCQLGIAFRWLDRWPEALSESKVCARMDPDSAEAHYRLARIYQHLGQKERAQEEVKLHDAAAKVVADQNAQRDKTMKTFLYTIQNQEPNHK